MSKENMNENSSIDQEALVLLTDENGNEQRYEFLDMINYADASYAVLVPENDDQVEIFLAEAADDENYNLTPVNSQETADAVFELFKTKNAEDFDFE